ncbi:MAG: VOC family protein [Defluviitaleaceae bacterium]|nr:VOC family protein [Defluviitaleaceae bacterium]
MQVKSRFDHYNINVYDLKQSLMFYEEALGLREVRRKEAEDGSFILVFLGDGETGFVLELTWLRDWEKPYNLGDNEKHLCVRVADDYAQVREFHREKGWICYENEKMGLYFIADPDGYWVEILPEKRN